MEKKQRQSKCCICKESFNKEDLIVKSNKKYCKECLQIKEEESNQYKNDWDLLFKYICNLYDIEVPTGMMFQQLKTFRNEYNYTNIGMYYTLKYYYEILENVVIEDTGLGIIPYYYDRAKKHYNKVYNLEDIVEDFKNEEKLIKVKTKTTNKTLTPKNPLPLNFDWEETNEDN